MSTNELDERHHFIWSGTNREKDIAALVEAIAAAVPGLCSLDNSIARLDGAGGLSSIGLAEFRSLLDKHICGMRVVQNGSGWAYDYYSFSFQPKPRFNPTNANPTPDASWAREPDAEVLDRIFRHELAPRLPRVVS